MIPFMFRPYAPATAALALLTGRAPYGAPRSRFMQRQGQRRLTVARRRTRNRVAAVSRRRNRHA